MEYKSGDQVSTFLGGGPGRKIFKGNKITLHSSQFLKSPVVIVALKKNQMIVLIKLPS